MSNLAVVGSSPAQLTVSNVYSWVFSNPFQASSPIIRQGPTAETRAHHVPKVPSDKPLLIDVTSGARATWAQVKNDALRVAASLHDLGVRPRSNMPPVVSSPEDLLQPVVMIHLPNCIPFASVLLGIFAAGLTATMANPTLAPFELTWILENSKPSVVVTTSEGQLALSKAIKELPVGQKPPAHVFVVDLQHDTYGLENKKTSTTPAQTRDWKHLLSSTPLTSPVHLTPAQCASQPALILWSSGTSGKSKGVMLSHSAMVHNILSLWHTNLHYNDSERWLGLPPFYHTFALFNILLLAPAIGATVYCMRRFEPKVMLRCVQEYRITYLHIAPPLALLLAKSDMVEGIDMSSVKGAVSGGAPCSSDIIEMVYRRLGILIQMGYGLTETGSVSNQTGRTWPALQEELGSSGSVTYGVEVKIASIDDPGKTCKRGEEGEILARNRSSMLGYLYNKEATAEALDKDGWFHTGDVGKIHRQGRLHITDRVKEVIKVKGLQVSPSDLEAILISSPLLSDAGVTAVYDPSTASEYPRAYVVPTDPSVDVKKLALQVKSWMEERTAPYKWLLGGLVFVKQIPKSPSGKILRRLLKDIKDGTEIRLYEEKRRSSAAKL